MDGAPRERGLELVERLTADLGAEDATARALELFRQACDADLLVGRSVEAVAAACVHCAARETGGPVPADVVAAAAGTDQGTLLRTARRLSRALDAGTGAVDPEMYVDAVVEELGAEELAADARAVVSTCREAGATAGKHPFAVAAAAVYIAARRDGVRCTQAEAAEAAGVSTVTVRGHYGEFSDILESAE